jgi:RimJ/RimL family protein N-acetyltransferase
MSKRTAPLQWESHQRWFDAVLVDQNRVLLIGEHEQQTVGAVRFDIAERQASISIFMAPGKSGQGLGAQMLEAAELWLRRERPEVAIVRAEVVAANVASHRFFSAAGYIVEMTSYLKKLHR